jgi:hypothetical protein
MARTGLTKPQVRACRDQLLAEGRYPSVDAVRQALGNTGSKSTIHRYLKELAGEDTGLDSGRKRGDTARSLHALVEELAGRLHDEAEQRMREKDEEVAALRRTIARLEARVEELEAERAFEAPPRAAKGFGLFDSRLSASRGGRAISPFSMMAAGARSEVFDVDSMRPPALKFL